MTKRRELDGEAVANDEKLFSIYEEHTDIIVKGQREVEFGHKVNLSTGKSGLILGCEILDGNPADSTLYQPAIEDLKNTYDIQIRDIVTDGGFASLQNLEFAQNEGIINIVFNKVVGSLRNLTTSRSIETRLKKWRSGIEAVISNLKRGFDLFRSEWKSKERFDAKVMWSVIAYNIRTMTRVWMIRLSALAQELGPARAKLNRPRTEEQGSGVSEIHVPDRTFGKGSPDTTNKGRRSNRTAQFATTPLES